MNILVITKYNSTIINTFTPDFDKIKPIVSPFGPYLLLQRLEQEQICLNVG